MKSIPEYFPESLRIKYRRLRARALTVNLSSSGPFTLTANERTASARISVIIPVHDSSDVVERCFRSLELFAGDAEIIVVDDGSRLPATTSLLDNFTALNRWKLIRHEKALGHSRASAAGVLAATKPLLCLLNSDTLVTSRTWAAIGEAFDLAPEVAVVGPSTSYTVGPQTVKRACYCRHYWSDRQIFQFAEKYTAAHSSAPVTDLEFVGGFAYFIRRAVWDAFDGFDRALPDYGNETELCVRIIKSGQRILWTKKSYIHHLGSESYGQVFGHQKIQERSLQAVTYVENKHRI